HREEVRAAVLVLHRYVVRDQRDERVTAGLVALEHVEVGGVHLRVLGHERRLAVARGECVGGGAHETRRHEGGARQKLRVRKDTALQAVLLRPPTATPAGARRAGGRRVLAPVVAMVTSADTAADRRRRKSDAVGAPSDPERPAATYSS